jgi:hypothetical protein
MESNALRTSDELTPAGPMSWDAELRMASNGLAAATLVVLLVFASQKCSAEPAASVLPDESLASLTAAIDVGDAIPAMPRPSPRREIDALLAVRGALSGVRAREHATDEAIADAVERGNPRELERKKPFRKKSTDLFRSEREIQIGDEEMLLRLRLRAKTRNAMSVELRF